MHQKVAKVGLEVLRDGHGGEWQKWVGDAPRSD